MKGQDRECFEFTLNKETVLFRDYLTSHREAFDEYAELKKELAQRHSNDRGLYTEGKRDFVERIIRIAKES